MTTASCVAYWRRISRPCASVAFVASATARPYISRDALTAPHMNALFARRTSSAGSFQSSSSFASCASLASLSSSFAWSTCVGSPVGLSSPQSMSSKSSSSSSSTLSTAVGASTAGGSSASAGAASGSSTASGGAASSAAAQASQSAASRPSGDRMAPVPAPFPDAGSRVERGSHSRRASDRGAAMFASAGIVPGIDTHRPAETQEEGRARWPSTRCQRRPHVPHVPRCARAAGDHAASADRTSRAAPKPRVTTRWPA